MITVERKVRFGQARGRRKKVQEGSGNCVTSTGRIPRVARLTALAIRFDQLIRDGVVADQAELARVGHVSRARLTQIMNLLNLAPDIQGDLLFLAVTERGRDDITEKQLRPIAAITNWRKHVRCGGICHHFDADGALIHYSVNQIVAHVGVVDRLHLHETFKGVGFQPLRVTDT